MFFLVLFIGLFSQIHASIAHNNHNNSINYVLSTAAIPQGISVNPQVTTPLLPIVYADSASCKVLSFSSDGSDPTVFIGPATIRPVNIDQDCPIYAIQRSLFSQSVYYISKTTLYSFDYESPDPQNVLWNAPIGFTLQSIVLDPTQQYLYISMTNSSQGSIYKIDITTVQLPINVHPGLATDLSDIFMTSDGFLYFYSGNKVYKSDNDANPIEIIPSISPQTGIAIDSMNQLLFVSNETCIEKYNLTTGVHINSLTCEFTGHLDTFQSTLYVSSLVQGVLSVTYDSISTVLFDINLDQLHSFIPEQHFDWIFWSDSKGISQVTPEGNGYNRTILSDKISKFTTYTDGNDAYLEYTQNQFQIMESQPNGGSLRSVFNTTYNITAISFDLEYRYVYFSTWNGTHGTYESIEARNGASHFVFGEFENTKITQLTFMYEYDMFFCLNGSFNIFLLNASRTNFLPAIPWIVVENLNSTTYISSDGTDLYYNGIENGMGVVRKLQLESPFNNSVILSNLLLQKNFQNQPVPNSFLANADSIYFSQPGSISFVSYAPHSNPSCPYNCSGHGVCGGGFCVCEKGYSGGGCQFYGENNNFDQEFVTILISVSAAVTIVAVSFVLYRQRRFRSKGSSEFSNQKDFEPIHD